VLRRVPRRTNFIHLIGRSETNRPTNKISRPRLGRLFDTIQSDLDARWHRRDTRSLDSCTGRHHSSHSHHRTRRIHRGRQPRQYCWSIRRIHRLHSTTQRPLHSTIRTRTASQDNIRNRLRTNYNKYRSYRSLRSSDPLPMPRQTQPVGEAQRTLQQSIETFCFSIDLEL
jgi:hypothetical protein